MKKAIATLSIILILLNMFVPYSKAVNGANAITQESVNGYNEGTGSVPSKNGDNVEKTNRGLDTTGNNLSALITALLEILIFPGYIVNWILSIMVGDNSTFTIQELLLNNYYLFDIDFFNIKKVNDVANAGTVNALKQNVAIWYYSLRNISMVGSAIIIIYVAIRIAIEIAKRRRCKVNCKI